MSDKDEGLVWFLWVVSQIERVARLQWEENRLLRCLHLAVVPLARFILVREPEAAAVWVLAVGAIASGNEFRFLYDARCFGPLVDAPEPHVPVEEHGGSIVSRVRRTSGLE